MKTVLHQEVIVQFMWSSVQKLTCSLKEIG